LKLLNAHWWYDPHPSPAMPGPLQVPPGVLTTRVPSTDAVTAPLEIVTCMCGERAEKWCHHVRAACINTHTHTHTHTNKHTHTHTQTHTHKHTQAHFTHINVVPRVLESRQGSCGSPASLANAPRTRGGKIETARRVAQVPSVTRQSQSDGELDEQVVVCAC
jgi:hypothetical protein